ncbi:NgoFVII restriction endonuclease [uncultured archaeon]|nr:NgoFVII restriction endonuclease [uncultured archaeon]
MILEIMNESKMELLNSNFPPLNTGNRSFADAFDELLFEADTIRIATGYITADSVAELQRSVELNLKLKVDLIIGMHYFDLFTRKEYQASLNFGKFLSEKSMGGVFLSTAFKYHGKIYSFLKNKEPIGSIVGSNNLSSITEYSRVYETSLLFNDRSKGIELNNFIDNLISVSKPIEALRIEVFNEYNKLLIEHENVETVDPIEVKKIPLTDIRFTIPLKVSASHSKSNLNVFFGKGREDKRGLIKPRHWYEIELIVPSEITSMNGYPNLESGNNIFDVITDDGWKFRCKVSGDYNKNLRSEGDLKILGKWLKGRLENAGALDVGELVTEETLQKYGRSDFELIKTEIKNLWYLNFGV